MLCLVRLAHEAVIFARVCIVVGVLDNELACQSLCVCVSLFCVCLFVRAFVCDFLRVLCSRGARISKKTAKKQSCPIPECMGTTMTGMQELNLSPCSDREIKVEVVRLPVGNCQQRCTTKAPWKKNKSVSHSHKYRGSCCLRSCGQGSGRGSGRTILWHERLSLNETGVQSAPIERKSDFKSSYLRLTRRCISRQRRLI